MNCWTRWWLYWLGWRRPTRLRPPAGSEQGEEGERENAPGEVYGAGLRG